EGALPRLTGASPCAANCAGTPPSRDLTNDLGLENEPFVAVDPGNPLHIIGVYQQDLWSDGGASGVATVATFDGGGSFFTAFPSFSRCGGGHAQNGGDFHPAGSPWGRIW